MLLYVSYSWATHQDINVWIIRTIGWSDARKKPNHGQSKSCWHFFFFCCLQLNKTMLSCLQEHFTKCLVFLHEEKNMTFLWWICFMYMVFILWFMMIHRCTIERNGVSSNMFKYSKIHDRKLSRFINLLAKVTKFTGTTN